MQGKSISKTDLIYMAGLFEAKGHLYTVMKKYQYFFINVKQKEIADFLKNTIECRVRKSNCIHKDGYQNNYYIVTMTGAKMEKLLKKMKPYFKTDKLILNE